MDNQFIDHMHSFEWSELQGKVLAIDIAKDDDMSVVIGIDTSNGHIYIIDTYTNNK